MERKHQYFVVTSLVFINYFNTLFGTFVFDDSEAIVKNKDVMPQTPILQLFQNDFWGTNISLNSSHKSYRPLTIMTYRINVLLSNNKLNAYQFHTTNIILYAILCLMLLPIFKTLTAGSRKVLFDVPFLSTILFTVHPIHTEVVAGLVGRADILSSILFFTTLIFYKRLLKNNSLALFLIISILVTAAVLCKETAITVLGFCIVYDFFHTTGSIKDVINNKSFLYRLLGLVTLGILIMYFRLSVMNFQGPIFTKIDNPAAYTNDTFSKIFTYNYIYFLNILLLLWPQWLCFDWAMGCIPLIESICDIRVFFIFILWIFVFTGIYIVLKKDSYNKYRVPTIMGAALIVLPFIPASNLFVKVGFVIAERTLLLPSAGFCLLVVIGFTKLIGGMKNNKIAYGIFYLICALLSMRTVQRNFDWLSEERLFNSALNVCPLNAKVHYNVAKVAADRHNKILAITEYEKAIELNPNYEQAMNNLANLLREDKKFEDAEVLLRKAVKVRPNFAAAWMNLGIVLTNLNHTKEAEQCFLKAITFRPKYPDCYYNLGNLYLDLKRMEEALKAWEKAVFYRPTHTAAWSNTLVLLDSLNKYERVLKLGRTALMHNPKSPALHFSLANTLGKLQKFENAEKHFLEALNFNPYNALYYSNLGVLYHRWGKTEKAREMYKRALQIDPKMKTTENNLKKLMNAQNDTI
ncbi:PREDICTED: transmembrane and TPR repeat-containing protein 4-like [Nicrophorus vespilloides]|uniref:dolichyl-phosphate-mannose--protein mannosyltransferase n=1 Tax=Nicrophorus vespilloides TaxID=110193 RepID=A0ABM1MXX7_NICVS|nr:PREDICTED: transmembrane and TPR repeat-containing protein 4-like [Nicrophorus vespilloides]